MKAFIGISILAVLALLSEIFGFKKRFYPIAIAGLVVILGLVVVEWQQPYSPFSDMINFDHYALSFSAVLLISAILWLLMSGDFFKNTNSISDYFALVLFTVAGGMMMTSFTHMSVLFLGLETLSLSIYVLAGSRKDQLSSNEAAFKYFLMGSFATGFLLFGIALIYGATGSFSLAAIAKYAEVGSEASPIFYMGILLMLVGLAFS